MIESLQQTMGLSTVLLILIIALITSALHGATGVAGGFLLSAAIAPIVGVAPIVPIISISLLISHASRAFLNRKDFDLGVFLAISVPAIPCIVIFAFLYGRMSSTLIAIVLGSVILISIPIRKWAKARKIKANKKMLSGIGVIYGGLSGVSIGPGMLLIPFMLGYGLSKEAFVATLAVIALFTNITRLTVFGVSDLFTSDILLIGLLLGLVTIPGNWLGRYVLRKMTNDSHSGIVDILSIIGALNFFWLAFR